MPNHTRIACILVGIFLTLPFIEPNTASPENEGSENTSDLEITFSGTNSETTKAFTVQDGWKIQWTTESPIFKLTAHGSARRPYVGPSNERDRILRRFEAVQPIVLANTTDSHGTAIHQLGGTFYFKIIANGPWRIDLKTFKDTKDYLDVPYTGAP